MKVTRSGKRVLKGRVGSDDGISGACDLRTVALSSSDLVVPRVHVEVIYAFENVAVGSLERLEDGLVGTLVEYREWAGRLSKDVNGKPVIALNDAGVVWVDADADVTLKEMMPFNPGWHLLELVPPNRGVDELLLVQVTRFRCGGISIGVARHHEVADGEAASLFMDAWASAVKGLSPVHAPLHNRSALFARDPPGPKFDHIEYKKAAPKADSEQSTEDPPLSLKKLHFSAEFLIALKSHAMKDLDGQSFYTTFESITAHLWRCITLARELNGEVGTRAVVAMNGRKRLSPPVPDNYFGNVIFHACACSSAETLLREPVSYAASLVKSAIKRVDGDYMRSALDFIELQQRNPAQIARGFRTVLSPNLSVTSWVNLPLYSLDFGWGCPIFAGPPLVPFEGLIILLPSHTKDGSIDAVIGLFTPDMTKLEEICYVL